MSDIKRIPTAVLKRLREAGTATVSGELSHLGVRDPQILGVNRLGVGDVAVAGTALTMQFMPKREDLYQIDEYADPEAQLHRHVLYDVQAGDIVVVDGRGDMSSGVYGEMMLTYLYGRGGGGLIVDGCVRDWAHGKNIGLEVWAKGVTPNFHTQTNLMPFAFNIPIACGGVTVMPGDAIIGDDDGVVVVPAALTEAVAAAAGEHRDWEEFARMRLEQGGDLRKYYPLTDATRVEYEQWRVKQG